MIKISHQMLSHYYAIAGTLWSAIGLSSCTTYSVKLMATWMPFAKKGNQQQCILETYDTCPAFVWDMEHLGTTRMCFVMAVMPAVV